MKLIEAYSQLRQLKLPVLLTQDVAAYFNISITHANKILTRLTEAKQMIHIKRGYWVLSDSDPMILPGCLTAPFPAYISLQTALYYHGMISQIPTVIYAVSIARTHLYQTPIASVSIHHLQSSFFFGYEEKNQGFLKIATPEKALIDLFYLHPAKSGLFHSLPELELPKNFNISIAKKIIERITSVRKKTLVKRLFLECLQK